jgi:hypothetical protein
LFVRFYIIFNLLHNKMNLGKYRILTLKPLATERIQILTR